MARPSLVVGITSTQNIEGFLITSLQQKHLARRWVAQPHLNQAHKAGPETSTLLQHARHPPLRRLHCSSSCHQSSSSSNNDFDGSIGRLAIDDRRC